VGELLDEVLPAELQRIDAELGCKSIHRPFEDVQEIAPYVLRHRLIVSEGTSPDEALNMALEQVPVPETTASLIYA